MSYKYRPKGNVQREQDRSVDRSLWNTKLKIFDVRFYTINHQELLSVVKVGFKPFQDLSSKTKAIAQSIQEKSVINGVKCTGHVQQKERNTFVIINYTKDIVLYFQ